MNLAYDLYLQALLLGLPAIIFVQSFFRTRVESPWLRILSSSLLLGTLIAPCPGPVDPRGERLLAPAGYVIVSTMSHFPYNILYLATRATWPILATSCLIFGTRVLAWGLLAGFRRNAPTAEQPLNEPN